MIPTLGLSAAIRVRLSSITAATFSRRCGRGAGSRCSNIVPRDGLVHAQLRVLARTGGSARSPRNPCEVTNSACWEKWWVLGDLARHDGADRHAAPQIIEIKGQVARSGACSKDVPHCSTSLSSSLMSGEASSARGVRGLRRARIGSSRGRRDGPLNRSAYGLASPPGRTRSSGSPFPHSTLFVVEPATSHLAC